MTLVEAIAHADEVAAGDCSCAAEHIQLAEWLRELRTMRVKLELADDIIVDVCDYQCDRAESEDGDTCSEILDEDDEPRYESDDWCPFCRARDWRGELEDGSDN